MSQCHSEERSDEESAFAAVGGPRSSVVSKQILHFVQDDSPERGRIKEGLERLGRLERLEARAGTFGR
jgi:hypothetical protein